MSEEGETAAPAESANACGRALTPILYPAVVAGGLFALLVVAIKPLVPPLGWAAFDAREYHFTVINYFIRHGFDLHFPPVLAMFPGMHAVFAAAAKGLGTGELAYEGWPAFLLQSVVAVVYVTTLVRLWMVTTSGRPGAAVLLLPLFCSSYPIYSWLWPTTDLGADACFVALLLLALRPGLPGWSTALVFAAVTVAATLLRQIYAPVGVGLLAIAAMRLWTGAAKGAVRDLALTLAPVVAAGAVLGALYVLWGGLLPPELRRHESSGIQFVTVAHAVALTGLVAWPFALPVFRLLGWWDGMLVAAAALGVAMLACAILPLDPEPEAGRGGSLVWTVAEMLHSRTLAPAFMGALLAIGNVVWLGCLRLAWRERDAAPELVLFGLFLATFLVQSMAWQRYVEVQILVVLVAFVARRTALRTVERAVFAGWFGAYAALSFVKPFLGFAGRA